VLDADVSFAAPQGFVIMKQAVRAKKQRNSREQLERSLFILDDMFRRPMLRVSPTFRQLFLDTLKQF
jgi:hypothetical protein